MLLRVLSDQERAVAETRPAVDRPSANLTIA
jgi:hypothetical protein